jgi:hypothetical protein
MSKKLSFIYLVILGFLVLLIYIPPANAEEEMILDFPLKKSQWEYFEEGEARAKVTFPDSKINIEIITSPKGAFHEIQLFKLKLNIEEGQKYALKINATSNREAEISCKFHKPSPNWVSYQSPEYVYFELKKGENSKSEIFVADRTTDRARFTCYFGQNTGETTITISSLKLYKIK